MSKNEVLFFGIIPRHAVWGGKEITSYFGYDVPDKTGQVWAFSAEDSASTVCQNGENAGKTLLELWNSKPELFQSLYKKFPYIISLVAPVENLSIQVHPTANVAQEYGYEAGKNEAWVILEAAPNSSLVYGSKGNFEDLMSHLKNADFVNIFRTVATKKGEFFYIPAGTVHALGKGNIAYEIQQSTDVTYRIYDYERLDDNNELRELQLPGAMESIKDTKPEFNTTLDYVHPKQNVIQSDENADILEYMTNESFTISRIQVHGSMTLKKQGYWLTTVSEGTGRVNEQAVRFGDNFLVPANLEEITLTGSFSLMITSEKRITK